MIGRAYSSRVDRALALAARYHEGQHRKGTDVPYIVHPVAVALVLERYGFDEDVVIAGLLHDTLEDTSLDAAVIEEMFGVRVLRCVQTLTEPDKSRPWEERKRASLERMRGSDVDAKAVFCADKVHNMNTIVDELGDDPIARLSASHPVWKRFRRGREAQLAHFEESVLALGQGFSHAIVDELRASLARLRG